MPNRMRDNSRAETIVVSGSARLPKKLIGEGRVGCLRIELELTTGDSKIIDFSCTEVLRLTKRILRNALLGHEIEEGIKNALNEVEKRFISRIKRATIAALKDVRLSYRRTQKG